MYELLFQDVPQLVTDEGRFLSVKVDWSHGHVTPAMTSSGGNILETSSHCPVQAFPSASFKINSDLDPQRKITINHKVHAGQREQTPTKFPSSVQRISVTTAAPAANESPHLSAVGFRRPCRLYGVMFRNRIPMSVGFQ